MRKMTMIAALTLLVLALMAAPAFAQKDPFHPVIDPDAGTTVVTDPGTGGQVSTPALPPNVGSDSLAETGMDVSPWVAIAYTLILMGAGALVIARMSRPEPVRTR